MLGESLVGMTAVVVNSLVNYGAVSFSSSLNVYCMRKPEIEQGISLLDPVTMQEVTTSKVAAQEGITKTIACRWIYLIPIFFTGPLLEAGLRSAKLMPRSSIARRMVEIAGIGLGLWTAMPLCCGFFPQYEKISVKDLEPEAQAKISGDHKFLLYNKGV